MRPWMLLAKGTITLMILAAVITTFAVDRPVAWAQAGEETIVFGINPWHEPDVLRKIHRPVLDHLEKALGVKVEMKVSEDYPGLIKMVQSGEVQLASFSPILYMTAKKEIPELEYVATCTRRIGGEVSESYQGYFLVKRDSPYQDLGGMKGKRFAFVNTSSSSGYHYAIMHFKIRGILDPETFFSEIVFAGSHPKVTTAIAKGEIDVGVTSEENYELAVKEHGDIFRIIEKTNPIPFDAYTAYKVPAELKKKFQTALVEVPEEVIEKARAAGFPYTGWAVKEESFYDGLRKVYDFIEWENSSGKGSGEGKKCFVGIVDP